MRPIIQVEFYHIRFDQNFENLYEEMRDRVRDSMESVVCGFDPLSSGIKTKLRFYDKNNLITNLVRELDFLSKREWSSIPNKPPSVFAFYINDIKRNLRKWREFRLERKLFREALRLIKRKLEEPEEVAGEKSDFSFRFIFDEEKYELLQSIQKSKKALWFVFAPNDILSDKNQIVTSYLG